jgi:hypothetical protein
MHAWFFNSFEQHVPTNQLEGAYHSHLIKSDVSNHTWMHYFIFYNDTLYALVSEHDCRYVADNYRGLSPYKTTYQFDGEIVTFELPIDDSEVEYIQLYSGTLQDLYIEFVLEYDFVFDDGQVYRSSGKHLYYRCEEM